MAEVALRGCTPEYSAAQTQLTEELDTSRLQLEASRSQAEQLRMEHAQAGAKCTVFDAELRPVSEGAERLLRALTVAAEALANERKRSEETSGALQAAGEAAAACSREEAERCREHTSASRDEWQRSLSELEVRQLELSQQCARSESELEIRQLELERMQRVAQEHHGSS